MKDISFYDAAAQIIPVLLLFVAFEIRSFHLSALKIVRWFALVEFIFIVGGEVRALEVLRTHDEGWADPVWTLAAIFVLLGTIGAALFPWFYGYDPRPPESKSKSKGKKSSK
jgi:hypothetical protein